MWVSVLWLMLSAGPAVAQDAISLVGSGSNLAGPLSARVDHAQNVKLHPGLKVTYLPLGTAQSLKEIAKEPGISEVVRFR